MQGQLGAIEDAQQLGFAVSKLLEDDIETGMVPVTAPKQLVKPLI
jgi:hypothetical protein